MSTRFATRSESSGHSCSSIIQPLGGGVLTWSKRWQDPSKLAQCILVHDVHLSAAVRRLRNDEARLKTTLPFPLTDLNAIQGELYPIDDLNSSFLSVGFTRSPKKLPENDTVTVYPQRCRRLWRGNSKGW